MTHDVRLNCGGTDLGRIGAEGKKKEEQEGSEEKKKEKRRSEEKKKREEEDVEKKKKLNLFKSDEKGWHYFSILKFCNFQEMKIMKLEFEILFPNNHHHSSCSAPFLIPISHLDHPASQVLPKCTQCTRVIHPDTACISTDVVSSRKISPSI